MTCCNPVVGRSLFANNRKTHKNWFTQSGLLMIGCSVLLPRRYFQIFYNVPVEGITTIFSTVVLSGKRNASTTV